MVPDLPRPTMKNSGAFALGGLPPPPPSLWGKVCAAPESLLQLRHLFVFEIQTLAQASLAFPEMGDPAGLRLDVGLQVSLMLGGPGRPPHCGHARPEEGPGVSHETEPQVFYLEYRHPANLAPRGSGNNSAGEGWRQARVPLDPVGNPCTIPITFGGCDFVSS